MTLFALITLIFPHMISFHLIHHRYTITALLYGATEAHQAWPKNSFSFSLGCTGSDTRSSGILFLGKVGGQDNGVTGCVHSIAFSGLMYSSIFHDKARRQHRRIG